MKKILLWCLCVVSFSCFANPQHASPLPHSFQTCDQAVPSTDPNFCGSFKAIADCHCLENGLPEETCGNMGEVYDFMLIYYKKLEIACYEQRDIVDQQICIDDWNCYRNGGVNSQGQLCSSTGNACS
jgi:hypothetical protein